MDILLYLSERLQQGKEVGLTGLGTFFKKKYPGRYDKEQKAFLPPSYKVQFKAEVAEDNNLANYIAEKRNISIGSANYFIEKFVDEVKQKLNGLGEFQLDKFGRLFLDDAHQIAFEPSNEVLPGSEYFGLPVVSLLSENNQIETPVDTSSENHPPLIETITPDEISSEPKEENEQNPQQEEDAEHVHAEEVEHDHDAEYVNLTHPEEDQLLEPVRPENHYFHLEPEKEATQQQPEEEEEHPHEEEAPENNIIEADGEQNVDIAKRPSMLWLKIVNIVIALIIVVAIVYLIKPEWFHEGIKTEKRLAKPVDALKTDSISLKAKKDSSAKTDSILKANLQQKTADTVNKMVKNAIAASKPATNVAAKKDSITFDVIVFASKSKQQAVKFVAKMKAKGYDAKIANMSGPWSKVSIASFATIDEALKQKDILQNKLKGSGYYVQQIKNNTQP